MKNILCFGDSLTAGYNNDGKNFYPYSKTLSKLLGNEYNVDFIGITGVTVDEILYNIDNDIEDINNIGWFGLRKQLNTKKYDYCILLIGSNDLSDYNSESVTEDILKLHKIIHELDVKSIALTIPRLSFERVDTDMKDVREQINKNLINNTDNINLYNVIDFASIIEKYDEKIVYDYDGLHLSKEGYSEMANIIYVEFLDICKRL